jgi:tripartite-type tricarboxylate transporter receptor subunit TctC
MDSNRLLMRVVALLVLVLGLHAGAHAQPYPNKPIKLILPNTTGSPVDALARVVAQHLQPRLGQSVLIDNRPGGGMTIGTKAVASADPDGYTLLLFNSGHFFGLTPSAGYDPLKSFTPVAMLAEWNHVLVVRPAYPAKSVRELIEYARANPGKTTFGFGTATTPQILGETLKIATGVDIASVPYRGGAQAVTDMMGGRIDMNFGTTATLLPLIQQQKVRALAYTGTKRTPDLPDLPTMIEAGFPQLAFNPDVWTAIAAPAGTPAPIIQRLHAAVNEALAAPELRASFVKFGFDIVVKPLAELESFMVAEAAKWPPVVKAAGLKSE